MESPTFLPTSYIFLYETMTLTYFNDINVYFHMKNHYKMLKHVKSVVDTSLPESLLKSPMAVNSLDKRIKGLTNENIRKIYNTQVGGLPKKRGTIKKHNCLLTKSEAALNTVSFRRPSTRRSSFTSTKPDSNRLSKSDGMIKFRQRKRSSVASTLSSNNSEEQSSPLDLQPDDEIRSTHESLPPDKKIEEKNNDGRDSKMIVQVQSNKSDFHDSTEEHEYLLFLLRITEDIISHEFFSNQDIKRIFKKHMDLNKDRLNTRKMHFHLANLCEELNIDCKEYQTQEFPDEINSPNKFKNSPNGHRNILNSEAFRNCHDCSVIRSSSLYKLCNGRDDFNKLNASLSGHILDSTGDGSVITPSLLRLLGKMSLGRVTECTEPRASTSTLNSPTVNARPIIFDGACTIPQAPVQSPVDFETFIHELNSRESKFINCLSKDSENDLTPSEDPVEEKISSLEPKVDNCQVTPSKEADEDSYEFEKVSSIGHVSEVVEQADDTIDKTQYNSEKEDIKSSSIIMENTLGVDQKVNSSHQANSLSNKGSDSSHLTTTTDEAKSSPEAPVSNPSKAVNTDQAPLKLFLQGTPNPDDYVMIKGPVYVYKPLLESEPKLIIFSDNCEGEQTRRSSLDSHRTFTVDHSHVLERLNESTQYEASLHSMDNQTSMENILELTKTAYSQFKDLQLLQSDYDLTPEKENSSDKYHNLLLDTSTSVSGTNITESLLLNDDYLMQNEPSDESKIELYQDKIDDYLRYTPKMFQNAYVIHKKLISSVSMPKLRLNKGCKENVARKCSSELIHFDGQSQDSSLRSEGETIQSLDYGNSEIPLSK